MRFNKLKEISSTKDTVSTFGGYNHNISSAEGEFYEMKNMSSSNYPTLSPRKKRTTYLNISNANGILAKDSLCYVLGTDLYVGGTKVNGITLSNTKKQMISMGSYIVIMPDKVYVNTIDTSDYGTMDNTVTTTSKVTYTMCNVSGEDYDLTGLEPQHDPPANPHNLDLWIDDSSTPHKLMQYSELQLTWVSIATSYIKISATNIAKGFATGDAVKISGISTSLTQLKTLEGQTSILWEVHRDTTTNGAKDYIVVTGMLDTVSYQTTSLTVARLMPQMDFVIESSNRLWGCRYGSDSSGNMVNEIYASKLGDPKNWNYFAGTAADSYVASCGSDGAFTGAITFLGYPMFFKEGVIHKVYGNYPSNYQMKNTECKGLMKGAANSLVICNDYLLFKSREGISMYDGSLPSEISSALGDIKYNGVDTTDTDTLRNGAIAGFVDNKYYISMKSEADNNWHLFVYDLKRGMWHREDNLRVDTFCTFKGELYYIDHTTKKINTILGSGSTSLEDDIEWEVVTNVIGTTKKQSRYSVASPEKKYISQMLIRMSMAIGSNAKFYIQYDSLGAWEQIDSLHGDSLRSFFVPIRPRRCDHFRIKITGTGDCNIYSYTKFIEEGSAYR